MEIVPGAVFDNPYPFLRTTYAEWDDDGPSEVQSWRPGVDYEAESPYGDYATMIAHGTGRQILTVIDIHKPGRFPTRVFYTMKWVTPDGKEFGKGGLKMTTVDAFRRRALGFMHGQWTLRESEMADQGCH